MKDLRSFFDDEGKIDPYYLRLFLEEQGFSLFQSHLDRKVNKELVFNDNGVLKSYNSTELRRWITSALETLGEDAEDLIRVWIKYPDSSLRTSVIDHMTVYSDEEYPDTKQLETFRDTQEECYLKNLKQHCSMCLQKYQNLILRRALLCLHCCLIKLQPVLSSFVPLTKKVGHISLHFLLLLYHLSASHFLLI